MTGEPDGDLRPSSRRQAERVLAIARDELGMDVAYLSEFVGPDQVVRHVVGDGPRFGLGTGTRVPLDGSYCRMVVEGELSGVIGDTAREPKVAGLPVTRDAGIGAYVGVPVRVEGGEVYGTLCCASRAAQPALDARETAFMRVLARVIGDALADDREREVLEAALTSRSIDLLSTTERLAASHAELVRRLSMAVEYRDDATGAHVQRVAAMSAALARAAGLPDADRVLIREAAPLHDVGKVAIPDPILLKPGRLTEAERRTMTTHTQIGHDLLSGSDAPALRMAATIALTHHERYDGAGYPHGLARDEIPLEGRIVALVDVFDALSHDRVYRPAWPRDRTVALLREGRGTHFDPDLVDLFLKERLDSRQHTGLTPHR
jgi:HD-GYP domain-containing protein (c-di-GMP phosphodiesterase class II)